MIEQEHSGKKNKNKIRIQVQLFGNERVLHTFMFSKKQTACKVARIYR